MVSIFLGEICEQPKYVGNFLMKTANLNCLYQSKMYLQVNLHQGIPY